MSDDSLYGPLAALIGGWSGDKGMDVAPEQGGIEENPYYESITFEAIGTVTNAETQELAALRYHQLVSRKADRQVFHNETGYWMWDAGQSLVMQTLTIPRGVCVMAGGNHTESEGVIELQVHAAAADANWPIIESPFMRDNASTLSFHRLIKVAGDSLSYEETTVLDIYGKRFDHTDQNSLTRVN
jgi:hypothetical protein